MRTPAEGNNRLEEVERAIAEALAAVERIDSYREDRETIARHLTNARKRVRQLRQKVATRRPLL